MTKELYTIKRKLVWTCGSRKPHKYLYYGHTKPYGWASLTAIIINGWELVVCTRKEAAGFERAFRTTPNGKSYSYIIDKYEVKQ